jgi:hypothetical protein
LTLGDMLAISEALTETMATLAPLTDLQRRRVVLALMGLIAVR